MLSATASPVPTNKPANYPAWWFSRGVIQLNDPSNVSPIWPDNYTAADDPSAAHLGQIKKMATAAYKEMQINLPGGAGQVLVDLINSWSQPGSRNLEYDPAKQVNP